MNEASKLGRRRRGVEKKAQKSVGVMTSPVLRERANFALVATLKVATAAASSNSTFRVVSSSGRLRSQVAKLNGGRERARGRRTRFERTRI